MTCSREVSVGQVIHQRGHFLHHLRADLALAGLADEYVIGGAGHAELLLLCRGHYGGCMYVYVEREDSEFINCDGLK